MESTPPTPQMSLGEVGYRAALTSQYAPRDVPEHMLESFAQLPEVIREAWSAAATAIVVEYDTRLFQEAETKAVNMGLDPQPLPGIVPPANA